MNAKANKDITGTIESAENKIADTFKQMGEITDNALNVAADGGGNTGGTNPTQDPDGPILVSEPTISGEKENLSKADKDDDDDAPAGEEAPEDEEAPAGEEAPAADSDSDEDDEEEKPKDIWEQICEIIKQNSNYSYLSTGRYLKDEVSKYTVKKFIKEFNQGGYAVTGADRKLVELCNEYFK